MIDLNGEFLEKLGDLAGGTKGQGGVLLRSGGGYKIGRALTRSPTKKRQGRAPEMTQTGGGGAPAMGPRHEISQPGRAGRRRPGGTTGAWGRPPQSPHFARAGRGLGAQSAPWRFLRSLPDRALMRFPREAKRSAREEEWQGGGYYMRQAAVTRSGRSYPPPPPNKKESGARAQDAAKGGDRAPAMGLRH